MVDKIEAAEVRSMTEEQIDDFLIMLRAAMLATPHAVQTVINWGFDPVTDPDTEETQYNGDGAFLCTVVSLPSMQKPAQANRPDTCSQGPRQ